MVKIRWPWQRKWQGAKPGRWLQVLASAALLDGTDPAAWREDAQPLIDLATRDITGPP